MEQFYKEVWGMSLCLHLLTVVDSVVTVAVLNDTMLALTFAACCNASFSICCKLL